MSELLRAERLSRAFGSLLAVDGVDLVVHRGEIQSFIGPNGAGKTTLFNVLTGSLPPTQGRILFKGEDVTGLTVHRLSRKRLATRLGVDESTVFRWECGRGCPGARLLAQVQEAFTPDTAELPRLPSAARS